MPLSAVVVGSAQGGRSTSCPQCLADRAPTSRLTSVKAAGCWPATLHPPRRDNHSAISKIIGSSSAVDISVVLSIESGSLRAAANRRACSKQRRIKAATNALERERCECPDPKLHPRKVAQSVVIVGPPRRCTMLREVVAIGSSRFLTEAYAAEMEGIPTALSPTPRRKRAHASTATLSPRLASQTSGSVAASARNAPP